MDLKQRPPRRKSSLYISKPQTPCNNKTGNFSTRFSLKAFVKRVDKLTPKQKEAITRTGFGKLLLIGNHMISKNLLVELMDRWHVQKQCFVIKGENIRISRMDVALILGLRVIGEGVRIGGGLDLPFCELETEYGAALWNRKVTLGSIEERLEELGECDDHDFVRAFLMFTFGTILFPNSTGKVDSRYLYFLQDVESVGNYAWGAAVLEDLVYWLGKRKEINVEYVGGCLILLQIWSYEHVDIARPSWNQPIKFPRACRWDNSKSHRRDWFIIQFRSLERNQISWKLDLTSEELESDIVKELLSQREMASMHIDLEPQANGALENEDCSNHLRSSPDITSNSMGIQLSSQCRDYCPQEKQNLNFTVLNVDVSNNQGDAALVNEKQKTDVISTSSDVSNNQLGVAANVRICQQVSQKGCSDQLRSSCDLTLTSMRDQHSSQPVCCSPQGKQYPNSSDVSDDQGDGILANNDCSKQVLAIFDSALTSSGDQCSSPFTTSCPQQLQKHNIIDISDDDNEEKSTSEDCDMEQVISTLRMENNDLKNQIKEKDQKLSEATKIEEDNMKLREEVETLKHQNLLHLSAFNIVNRLNSIVFSETADEVLGTDSTVFSDTADEILGTNSSSDEC